MSTNPTLSKGTTVARRKQRSKAAQGLVTSTICYRDRRGNPSQDRTLTVDVRRGDSIDEHYAAAMVAVRTGVPLEQVHIVRVRQP